MRWLLGGLPLRLLLPECSSAAWSNVLNDRRRLCAETFRLSLLPLQHVLFKPHSLLLSPSGRPCHSGLSRHTPLPIAAAVPSRKLELWLLRMLSQGRVMTVTFHHVFSTPVLRDQWLHSSPGLFLPNIIKHCLVSFSVCELSSSWWRKFSEKCDREAWVVYLARWIIN